MSPEIKNNSDLLDPINTEETKVIPFVPNKTKNEKQLQEEMTSKQEADLLIDNLIQQTGPLISPDKINDCNNYTAAIGWEVFINSGNSLVIKIPYDMLDTRDAIKSRYQKFAAPGCSVNVSGNKGWFIAVIEKTNSKGPALQGDLITKVKSYWAILHNQNWHAIVFIPGESSKKQGELQDYINQQSQSLMAGSSQWDGWYYMHIQIK